MYVASGFEQQMEPRDTIEIQEWRLIDAINFDQRESHETTPLRYSRLSWNSI